MKSAAIDQHLDDPIARHMATDFNSLSLDQTVGQALALIRQRGASRRVLYFYVVDAQNRLQGVVPARQLLLSALETPLSQIMESQVIAIPEQASVLEACEYFTLHRLLAFPVIDRQGRLMGIVDVELYADELEDIDKTERAEALFQLIGVHLIEAQQRGPLSAFRGRFPWLLCNVAGGLMAAVLARLFEAELRQVVALSLFIPVVLALAESVSIQSVSISLQMLKGQSPSIPLLWAKLQRELATGSLLGAAAGLAVGATALVWLGEFWLALCLAMAIAGGVAISAVLGVAIPNLLRILRRDPRVAAGPVSLAVADMSTLCWYFALARWLLM